MRYLVFKSTPRSGFRIFYDEAALIDKVWVTASIFTSLLLSFTIVVQCMPEVRDWLWYRHRLAPFSALFRAASMAIYIIFGWFNHKSTISHTLKPKP